MVSSRLTNELFFFGYDVIFKLTFTIITLFVSYYSAKAYKISKNKNAKLFSMGFFLLSISYMMQTLFGMLSVLIKEKGLFYHVIGLYLHLLFFLLAASLLVIISINQKNLKTYSLVSALSIAPAFLSSNSLYLGFISSSILLFFLFSSYAVDYTRGKKQKSFILSSAFFLLFLSHVHFILSVNHIFFYAVGNVLELIAYLLILINLIIALSK